MDKYTMVIVFLDTFKIKPLKNIKNLVRHL